MACNSAAPDYAYSFRKAHNLPLHAFESQGPRTDHQDRVCAFRINADGIDETQLHEIFAALAKGTADMHRASGATVNLALVGNGQVIAGNIGDGMTSIFSRAKGERKLQGQRLSTTHNPYNPNEMKRLEPTLDPFGVYVSNGLLCLNDGMRSPYLMMTRALGQHQYGEAVAKTPSEIHTTAMNADGLNIYALTLYSDGAIRVADDWGVDFDAEIDIYAREGLSPRARIDKPMALHMGEFASRQGLTDDASILSLDLRHLKPEDRLLLGVFDGNGNEGAAYAEKAVEILADHPLTLQRVL